MSGREQKTILLVENEAILSTAEAETIERFGYKAITANTGEKAIESVLSNAMISLILMDIDLGGEIDGPEAARQILQKRNIPIVFLISYSEKEDVERVKEVTHYGYVIKNSGDFVLRSSIEMALELFETHKRAREREESLQRAEIISGFGSWEFNLTTKTVNASEGARRIYGLGDIEWTIDAVQKIPLPEYRSMLDTALFSLVKQGLPYDIEFKALRPSDNKCINIHSMAKYDSVRNVVTGTIQDITDRKRAEEALKESETKYRSLFENAIEGIFQTTPEGKFISANPAQAKLFGYDSPQELMEQITAIGKQHYVNPEDRETYKNTLEAKGIVKGFEVQLLKKDGNPIWVSLSTHVVRNEEGAVIYYEGNVEDITDRKQAEEEITREKEKLKTLSDNAPSGMVLIDKEGHFTYINRKFSELFGYDLSDIPDGRTWCRKAYPDAEYRQTVISAWVEDLRDDKPGKQKPNIFTVTCKDGTQKIVQFIFSVLISGDYLMTCEDITEMRQLENQLRQAQKTEAIGTLAGGVAHDFNNILTVLMGYATLIQTKMDTSHPLRSYVDQVLLASRKAADLTQSLLTFSRRQSEALILVPLDMTNTIKVAEKLLRRLLTENIELRTSFADDDMVVIADKSQMDQILFNLVTNARDAMPKGGLLTIETAIAAIDNTFIKAHGFGEPGEYVQISISDTGTGMDEITRRKIFDPFFTTKEVEKGTGLGLAIVYGIVKQHNGHIAVESKPDQGTAFHIYLPAVKMKVDETEDTIIPVTRGNETILIAEDDTDVRHFIRDVLQGYGYAIREATDGEDAIKKFKQHRNIDLVVIDSVMPKKNGRETYNEIHRIDPHIKVLFTSGYTKDIFLDKGIESKEFDFIAKPLSIDDLLSKVREVLDR